MCFFNKYFFIGVGVGVVLTLVFIVAIIYVLNKMMSEKLEVTLDSPEFPSDPKIAAYGQADYRWSVWTLDGSEVALSQFKGKVLFLNFWATWCQPCIAEMPSIQSLYDSLRHENVAFLLISHEDDTIVRQFMEKKRFTFPIYLQKGESPRLFQTDVIPATFILNRDGGLVFKHVGSAKWNGEPTFRFLRRLMQ
jgi:thiol-disulfide isomerase/thioredoxin